MKKFKNSLLVLSLAFVVVFSSACAGISKREKYSGNIMGIEADVIAEHIGDKLTKVQSEFKIQKNMLDMYFGLVESGFKMEDSSEFSDINTGQIEILKSALKSFNNFSLKMFNGVEIKVENDEKDGITINVVSDYKKFDKETLKTIMKFAPTSELESVFNEKDIYSFSKFEENILKQGLIKKKSVSLTYTFFLKIFI